MYLLETYPSLTHALKQTTKSEWFGRIGMVSNSRFSLMLERHPELLAGAISSTTTKTFQTILWTELPRVTTPESIENVGRQDWANGLSSQKRKILEGVSRRQLVSVVRWLKHDAGFSTEEATKMVSKFPRILLRKQDKLSMLLNFFIVELGLVPSEVRQLLLRWPSVTDNGVDSHLRPSVGVLKRLGSPDWKGWKRIVVKYPQVLTRDAQTLSTRIRMLGDLLGIEFYEEAVALYPAILWLSPDLLKSKVDFLKDALCLNSDEMEILLETFPQVLGLSVENNLEPKITFLKNFLTEDELKDFVMYLPSLLGYSLEKRIKPRLKQMTDASIAFAYTPPYLMSLTDTKYREW